MIRIRKTLCLLAALGAGLAFFPAAASAQIIAVYQNPVPVVQYYQVPAPVVVAPPNVSYSLYPPTTVYSPPPTTVYAAPAAPVYVPTTVATTGVVTTQTQFGLGILRPFGWSTRSYYTPSAVYVNPPRVSYYPVYP